MKIMLSSLENAPKECKAEGGKSIAERLVRRGIKLKWNLMSYYYIRPKRNLADYIRDNSELVMIDSGAHSFQKGTKVDFDSYTKQYADFIKEFDRDNVVGYFEMDVDNIIGYEKVLEYRNILEKASDKIIPVWHKCRGIERYKQMCKDYSGRVVAVTGFKNEDIQDSQYLMFLKEARKYGCKVHCLGMTRKNILDKVPFDYTDSSSWSAQARFGRLEQGKVSKEMSKTRRGEVFVQSYINGIKMQEHYYRRWKNICGD